MNSFYIFEKIVIHHSLVVVLKYHFIILDESETINPINKLVIQLFPSDTDNVE